MVHTLRRQAYLPLDCQRNVALTISQAQGRLVYEFDDHGSDLVWFFITKPMSSKHTL